MTWPEYGVAICGLVYASNAVLYATRGEWPWVVAYAGYAFANIGLIWAAIWMRQQ
jgi:ABC-type multidrug transport system permease subunit